MCNAGGVPLFRWRIGVSGNNGMSFLQGGLCEGCSRPLTEVFESALKNGNLVTRCVNCLSSDRPLRNWGVGRIDLPDGTITRRVHVCNVCAAPIVAFGNRLRGDEPKSEPRVVESIRQLLPSRALYVQQHGGQLPPPELGLR